MGTSRFLKFIPRLPFSILKKRNYEPNTLDLFIFKRNVIRHLINEVGLIESPKWNRAVIPPKFFSSRKLASLVIRGYFDTDGCVVITNNNGTMYPIVSDINIYTNQV